MMRRMCLLGVVIALACVSASGFAQDGDPLAEEMDRWTKEQQRHLSRLFEIFFDQVRAEETIMRIPGDLLMEQPEYALDVLERYQADECSRVQFDAYRYAYRIGRLTRNSAIRERVVLQLAKAVRDAEPAGGQIEARWLLSFKQHEFTSEACDMLRAAAVKEPIREDVLLVLGVAGMNEMDSWLKKISDTYFNAVLALARLGDDEAARQAVERAKKVIPEKDKNKGCWVTNYLKRLAYTRHPIALAYIAQFLDSDEGERTLKETGDYYAPPYKQVAIGALAEHFPDCPVKHRKFGRYSDAEFAEVSEWVKKRLEDAER